MAGVDVDVPQRVTAALAPHAKAGRVPVEGTVRGTLFRATLIPVGGGRQRLYLPGGLRAAAGVGVGDTVQIVLHPVAPGEVTVPDDLVAALAAEGEVRAAFDVLAPAHRRELLRFLDDARTPTTRVRRVGQVVDQVLGRPAVPSPASAGRPLWTCPACGNRFVNRNAYHSCATYQVDDCFRGKPPEVRALFDVFRAMVAACGPVTVVPYRDRVGFMVDVRFAQATPRRRWLDVGFWLTRRVDSPRFWKIETIYPYAHVHVLRVTSAEQLDDEVAGWVREAYAVGRREHLGHASPPRPPR